jgi:hypothetical protein
VQPSNAVRANTEQVLSQTHSWLPLVGGGLGYFNHLQPVEVHPQLNKGETVVARLWRPIRPHIDTLPAALAAFRAPGRMTAPG